MTTPAGYSTNSCGCSAGDRADLALSSKTCLACLADDTPRSWRVSYGAWPTSATWADGSLSERPMSERLTAARDGSPTRTLLPGYQTMIEPGGAQPSDMPDRPRLHLEDSTG